MIGPTQLAQYARPGDARRVLRRFAGMVHHPGRRDPVDWV